MWKYLIFNGSWLLLIFAVQFFAPRAVKAFTACLILAGAVYLAVRTPIDPFAWFYYFIFSILAFVSASGFKTWVFAQVAALGEEIVFLSARLEVERQGLAEQTARTAAVEQKAAEIGYLYDATRQMSESLDSLATFLLLGESLSRNLRFGVIKLILFEPTEKGHSPRPSEVYQLARSDFRGLFDKSVYLRDKSKASAELYPSDQIILEHLAVAKGPIMVPDPSSAPSIFNKEQLPARVALIAHSVVIDHEMAAVLMLTDIDKAELPMLSILVERFTAEIRRVKLYERIQMLAITDGLTGVYVRRHLAERFERELARCHRQNFKLSFLMIDIDHFKDFNDRYGHLVGDVVLQQVAETIKKSVRELDLVGRYGGEEFGVLLIETDAAVAFLVADRIRRTISERLFKAYDEELRVTVSVGVSAYSEKMDQMSLIVDAADSALYQAKKQGRDKVVVS